MKVILSQASYSTTPFAFLSKMNTLMRLLKSEKIPMLKTLTVLPLSLSQEKDSSLLASTDNRLACFNHEVSDLHALQCIKKEKISNLLLLL